MQLLFSGEDASSLHSGSLSPTADSVASELQGLTPEEQERQKAEWSAELAKVMSQLLSSILFLFIFFNIHYSNKLRK